MYYSNRHYRNNCDCVCNDGCNDFVPCRPMPPCRPQKPCKPSCWQPHCCIELRCEPFSGRPPEIKFEIKL